MAEQYSWISANNEGYSAGKFSDVDGNIMPWSRSTVADGKWLNREMLLPFSGRDQYLLKSLNQTYDECSAFSGDLQSQINVIEARTDVIDVVGNHDIFVAKYGDPAALGPEDISDGDIIKVLNDATTDYSVLSAQGDGTYVTTSVSPSGVQSYYRYLSAHASESLWEYVGYLEPYYNNASFAENIFNLENTDSRRNYTIKTDLNRFIQMSADGNTGTIGITDDFINSASQCYTALTSHSASWDETSATLNSYSANWQATYSAVSANSAIWNETAYVPLSALECKIGSANDVSDVAFAQGSANSAVHYSLAQGLKNNARNNSIAIGNSNSAENQSFAVGINNLGTSEGFSHGVSNESNADSLAQGQGNSAKTRALAQGYYNYAYYYSLAQGKENKAETYSLAQGISNSAKSYAAAFGTENDASETSITQGNANTASYQSIAIGDKNSAYLGSVAMGSTNVASTYSQAFGNKTSAISYSMAIGKENYVSGDGSIAGGVSSNIIGNGTLVIGEKNAISADASIVAGKNNTVNEKDKSAPYFVIGNDNIVAPLANNWSYGNRTNIIAGYNNKLSGLNSVLVFGRSHTVSSDDDAHGYAYIRDSLIVGEQNTLKGQLENVTVLGQKNAFNATGAGNFDYARDALIAGYNNTVNGSYKSSMLLGGENNVDIKNGLTYNTYGNVILGEQNRFVVNENSHGMLGAIIAGLGNEVSGSTITVIGQNNNAHAVYSNIFGDSNRVINSAGYVYDVAVGNSNVISGNMDRQNSFTFGGYNRIYDVKDSMTVGFRLSGEASAVKIGYDDKYIIIPQNGDVSGIDFVEKTNGNRLSEMMSKSTTFTATGNNFNQSFNYTGFKLSAGEGVGFAKNGNTLAISAQAGIPDGTIVYQGLTAQGAVGEKNLDKLCIADYAMQGGGASTRYYQYLEYIAGLSTNTFNLWPTTASTATSLVDATIIPVIDPVSNSYKNAYTTIGQLGEALNIGNYVSAGNSQKLTMISADNLALGSMLPGVIYLV